MVRLLAACLLVFLGLSSAHAQRRVEVASAMALQAAIDDAMPGDEIVLSGRFNITGSLRTRAAGTEAMPIVVRSDEDASLVRFDSDGGFVEGFLVAHDYWTFEGLRVEGVCSDDSRCEHAWHIVGAQHTVIRNNEAFNFNAHIKANGNGDEPRRFTDDTLVESNHFYNTAPRQTSNPVTPVDVVGGQRFIIRANYIHDFEKAEGNRVSYAAFLKGAGRDGIIERNLVVCSQDFEGGVRLGLSFGGGGTGPDRICEGGSCAIEHFDGVMRNNIIAHCSDVGIYINECEGCTIAHNTVYDTSGIDFRFDVTRVTAFGNLYGGRIRDRDDARSERRNNIELDAAAFNAAFGDPDNLDFSLVDGAMFADMGDSEMLVFDDYCGAERGESPDIGAVEFGEGCDTTRTYTGSVGAPPADGGGGVDGGTDAGAMADAGAEDGGAPPPLDAGTGSDGGGTRDSGAPDDDEGGGCAAGAAGHSGLVVIALFVLFGRRRRR